MNAQGRPTQPGEATPARHATFTGNRGLDIDAPAPFADRLGGHARANPIGPPGLAEP